MAVGKKCEDLTGQRFGKLVVVSLNEEVSEQKKRAHWNCKCDCGNEKVVRHSNLKNGRSTSCGCPSKGRDLTGQKFDRLTVVKEYGRDKYGKILWLCKCECGNEKVVRGTDLRCGKFGEVISCGCYAREKWKEVMREIAKEKWQDEEFIQMHKNIHWKGGITPIKQHLSGLLVVEQWRSNSKQQVNYTCELTGKAGGVNTHHLKAFNTIVLEAHELNNIQIKPQVKDYTEKELHKLEEYVASWHKNTNNAVVLSEEVHMLFHSLYGKGGNTPEQFEEFRERYMAGEFKDLI